MNTKSIWKVFSNSTDFPTLKNNIKVDTLIIGGGVTGITLAQLLSTAGHSTALLEKDKIGEGTSSQSTGNLYVTIDKMFSQLSSKYDNNVVKQVVAARKSAMDLIVENVEKHHIDCNLLKRPFYFYSINSNDDAIVKRELDAANKAGLDLKEVDVEEVPLKVSTAIKLEDQYQFNPMKYVQGLAKSIDTSTCHIFENSEAKDVTTKDGHYLVKTNEGAVEAKNIVHATHTPKGVMFIQTLLGPYREYGIACKLKEKIDQKGIFWGYHNKEKFSTRIYETSEEQFLLVIGKPHKVGQAENNSSRIEDLEKFAKEHFSVDEVIYRWGGQHYRPADMLPYIGEQSNNEYIATGFSTDGLVYGTLSGMMIKDQILAKENEFSKLFDPNRHQPLKAAKEFAKENLNVAKQYFDLMPNFNDDDFDDILVGEGNIVSKDGKKLAVHRCDDNSLIVKSAYCTHLGCAVNWNNAEKTWDCPCHGSRFSVDGKVLEGPAFNPLKDIDR